MTALAATLQKASLQKKDLELELDVLEKAATMVVEEEQQASSRAPESCSDSSSASCDSSSDSSSESEESEAEGQGCSESKEERGGGGETSKDNPLQPQPTSSASPIPQTPTSALFPAEKRKVDAPLSASEDCRQLIQELGEQLAEELRVSPDSSYNEEGQSSQLSDAAAKTEEASGGSSSGTLLEPSPHRNPLLIVQTQEDLDHFEWGFLS